MKPMRMTLLTLSMLLMATAALAHDPVPLTDIPLRWAPSTSIADMDDPKPDLRPIMDVQFQIEKFTDARQDHTAIGENREDEGRPKPVTTKDDVGQWVSDGVRTELSKAGLDVVTSGGKVILGGEVRQLFSTETGVYRTDVAVRLNAHTPDGKVIWSGIMLGHDTHFGHSYKAENYYQNLSDAVLDALHNLLTDKDFIAAMAKG